MPRGKGWMPRAEGGIARNERWKPGPGGALPGGPAGAGDARGGSRAPAAVPCPGARSGRSWPPSSHRLRPRPPAPPGRSRLAAREEVRPPWRRAARWEMQSVPPAGPVTWEGVCTWNHRIWLGSDLKTHPVPPPPWAGELSTRSRCS